jgi:hypothetical protein
MSQPIYAKANKEFEEREDLLLQDMLPWISAEYPY